MIGENDQLEAIAEGKRIALETGRDQVVWRGSDYRWWAVSDADDVPQSLGVYVYADGSTDRDRAGNSRPVPAPKL